MNLFSRIRIKGRICSHYAYGYQKKKTSFGNLFHVCITSVCVFVGVGKGVTVCIIAVIGGNEIR